MLSSSRFGILSAVLCVFGCASEDAATNGDKVNAEVVEQPATDRVVASLELGYGTLNFHSITADNGTTAVYAQETHSAYLSDTPLDRLISKENPTNLELFLAIAPEQEPPQELLDSHAGEAKQRLRDNADVRAPAYDRDAPVPKGTAAACSNWVYEVPNGNYLATSKRARDNVSGLQSLCVGGTGTTCPLTGRNVTMGICNESNQPMTMQWKWAMANAPSTWYTSGTATIPAFSAAKQFNLNLTTGVSCGTPSNPCIQILYPKYNLYGSSASGQPYRMRTVEYQPSI